MDVAVLMKVIGGGAHEVSAGCAVRFFVPYFLAGMLALMCAALLMGQPRD